MRRTFPYLTVGILCVVLGLLQLSAFAQTPAKDANPTIERIPAPAWVKPVEVDFAVPFPKGQSDNSSDLLLYDVQVHAGEKVWYRHVVDRLLSKSGVQEGGRITVSFDPSYETLTLHKLIVHRNGETLDRLAQQEIKLLQREQGLDRHLYDGNLSAVILLEDIRPGDTIEYAYSTKGANPIFAGKFIDTFLPGWGVPVHKFRYRLLAPNERNLSFQTLGLKLEPKIGQEGNLKVYTWERDEIPRVITDSNVPSWFNPYGRVQISEFQNWRDVVDWASHLYVVTGTLPDDLVKEIDTINAAQTDAKARAIAALRLVQNNIRYLGMETGVHGYKPYPVDTVWKRRFGDCKDKSLLLCAILRNLGMEAYPALVHTDYQRTIGEWLPSPYSFNHLVVNLCLEGRDYWLDPTMSNQGGGLDQVYFPNYGKALVIRDDTSLLADITPGGLDALGIDVTSEFGLGEFPGEIGMKIQTICRGRNADVIRNWFANLSRSEAEKRLTNFYSRYYPNAEVSVRQPIEYKDDLEKNEVTVLEQYRISEFWKSQASDRETVHGDFSAATLAEWIDVPRSHVRTMPLAISHPLRVTETLKIAMPNARQGLTAEEITVKDPAFHFSYARKLETNGLNIRMEFEMVADEVAASRAAEYRSKIREVAERTAYEISLPSDEMDELYGKESKQKLTQTTFKTAPDAAEPSAAAKGFLLAPFFLVGGIGAAWALRKVIPGLGGARGEGGRGVATIHQCHACGCTEHTAPHVEFRVAANGNEYCRPHLPR